MDGEKITYFAETDYRNQKTRFGIKAKDRTRHMYVIGMTGMGKSTMLENLAIQDIQNGEGIVFIDPHGGSAEKLLHFVPEHRINDVIYIAPFDLENPISFNVMEDSGPDTRHLIASGLMSTFKKIWADAWSARMEYILQNTLLALLEYPGATLLGVNKMLSDKEYRKKVVDNITDPSVRSFWVDEFAKYTEKFAAEATPAIQNKIGQFTANPLIRNMIGQAKSSFDIRKCMDTKKIILLNLSKGRIGESNTNLLGGMFITKLYLAAMSRADLPYDKLDKLPNCYLYVDEFQSFANDSFANILAEARKYKLNLIMAHQYVEQMSEAVRAAVFGNVGTMIVFRVGPTDGEHFQKEFSNVFTADDIVSLGLRQVYLRLMIDGVGSKPFSARTFSYAVLPENSFYEEVIKASRNNYASARAPIEEEIRTWLAPTPKAESPKKEYDKQDYKPEYKSDYKSDNSGQSSYSKPNTSSSYPKSDNYVKKTYPPRDSKPFAPQVAEKREPRIVQEKIPKPESVILDVTSIPQDKIEPKKIIPEIKPIPKKITPAEIKTPEEFHPKNNLKDILKILEGAEIEKPKAETIVIPKPKPVLPETNTVTKEMRNIPSKEASEDKKQALRDLLGKYSLNKKTPATTNSNSNSVPIPPPKANITSVTTDDLGNRLTSILNDDEG